MGDDAPQHVAFVCPHCEIRFLRAAPSGDRNVADCPRCDRPVRIADNPPEETLRPADSEVDDAPTHDVTDKTASLRETSETDREAEDGGTTMNGMGPIHAEAIGSNVPTPEGAGSGSSRADDPLRETAETRVSTVDRIDISSLIDAALDEPDEPTEQLMPTPPSSGPDSPDRQLPKPSEVTDVVDESPDAAADPSESVDANRGIFLSTAEIRNAIDEGLYRLRVDGTVFGPVDVDALIPLVKQGLLVAVSAISVDGGEWQPVTRHPALATLRNQLARGIRDHLEARETADLPSSGSADASRETVPDEETDEETTDRLLPSSDDDELDDDEPAGLAAQSEPPLRSPSPPPPPTPSASASEASTSTSISSSTSMSVPTPPDLPKTPSSPDSPASPEPPQPETPKPETPDPDPPATRESRSRDSMPALPPEPDKERLTQRNSRPKTAQIPRSSDSPDAEVTSDTPVDAAAAAYPSGMSNRRKAALFLLTGLLASAGALLYAVGPSTVVSEMRGAFDAVRGALNTAPVVIDDQTDADGSGTPASDARSPEFRRAVATARGHLHEAAQLDPEDPAIRTEVARRLADAGRTGEAARMYRETLDALLDEDRHQRARRIAVDGIQRFADTEPFVTRFRRAIRQDDALANDAVLDLGGRDDIAGIRPAGGIDFDGLVLEGADGQPAYLFAPYRGGERAWRDDVAAWRLCRMVQCRFDLPKTRPARISREDYSSLLTDDDAGGWAPSELEWTRAPGPNDRRRNYAYGSLRKWPGDITRWPLEARTVWYDWLSSPGKPKAWDEPLTDALADLKDFEDGAHFHTVHVRAEGMGLRNIAAQLSDIFVFDYLTNNWNRFTPDDPGAYNHFARGGFVTIRTDTALQRRNSTRVKGRFHWINQYSRDTVTAIRALDPSSLDEMLYPDASKLEQRKVEILKGQRRRLLKRVDALASKHGADAIFPFE